MSKHPYPPNTTHKESLLCHDCIFKDEPIYCKRWHAHKHGCKIINSRLINEN
jgi:hypothetical protein